MEAKDNNYPSVEGFIREEKEGWGGSSESDELECTVILKENMVVIEKRSFWRGKPRGEKKILYNDITTLDYDKGGLLSLKNDGIQIHAQGFVFTIRKKSNTEEFEQFYQTFSEKVINAKESASAPISSESKADELAKFHDLKEKGIISEEEFEKMKKELLGL